MAAWGALVCVSAVNSEPAQPAATGPWAKMPALTTACFSGADPFTAKLDAAVESVKAGRSEQQAINDRIAAEYKSIDPNEMMSRMQQWMMSNPQEATKYLQQVQAVGNEMQTGIPEDGAAQQRFEAERADLIERYQAALAQAYAPATARWNALLKKLGVTDNIPSVKDPGTPQWAWAEEDAVSRERDKLYQANCPQWWGAAGPMQAWLKKYRAWMTQEHIPLGERMESQTAQTYAMINTPSASYRSLAAYDGVIKYMEVVGQVFAERRDAPSCTATECGHW